MSQGEITPPVCPRHPDYISYVRCQRCNRPVCPQCQVPSAVGVHCVDCAHGGNRSQPVKQSAVLSIGKSRNANITIGLAVICVAVYILQLLDSNLIYDFGFVPAAAISQPWRFLTTAFLHGSIMHVAFNVWALWVCGSSLEPVLGKWKFTALYGLSALGGSTMIYALASPTSTAWLTLTVGASGAVFGLFAAIFVIQRRFGRDTSSIVGLLVINVIISVLGAGVSWQGHLGGLITGAIVAFIFAYAPRQKRFLISVCGCIGVAVVIFAVIAVKTLLLT